MLKPNKLNQIKLRKTLKINQTHQIKANIVGTTTTEVVIEVEIEAEIEVEIEEGKDKSTLKISHP